MKASAAMIRTFEGRTAIVTGAASGIGLALTRLLLSSGATVHALDFNEAGLAALAAENPGKGKIHTARLNVCDRETYAAVIEGIRQLSGSIDFLFNNAGVTQLGEAQNIPFERWKWLLDINLMGVINGTHLVYPIMIEQGSGHIINTASVAGATGYATAAAYTASKAAVLEFTRSLRAEAKIYGVRISVACPGYVNSSIFSQDRVMGADCDAMIRDIPVKMMTPDQAAAGFLKGVIARKDTIVFPFTARFLWALSCWTPVLIGPFQKRFLRVFQNG
ncbi:MAG: SDR family oxidoreductase [Verrucomicrobiota bacterium]